MAAFRAFLRGQGEERELVWVTREDLAWRGGLLIRVRAGAEAEAAEKVKAAAEQGFGFGLEAVAVLGERLCCSVMVPASVADAADRWIGLPFVCKLRKELPIGREPGLLEWLLARPAGDLLG